MLIRSQDKKAIVNINNVDTISIIGNVVFAFNGLQESRADLGTYSTEEKAIKALDMIQNAYERNQIFSITYSDGLLSKIEERHGFEGSRELIGVVFKMPQDNEVEV